MRKSCWVTGTEASGRRRVLTRKDRHLDKYFDKCRMADPKDVIARARRKKENRSWTREEIKAGLRRQHRDASITHPQMITHR